MLGRGGGVGREVEGRESVWGSGVFCTICVLEPRHREQCKDVGFPCSGTGISHAAAGAAPRISYLANEQRAAVVCLLFLSLCLPELELCCFVLYTGGAWAFFLLREGGKGGALGLHGDAGLYLAQHCSCLAMGLAMGLVWGEWE